MQYVGINYLRAKNCWSTLFKDNHIQSYQFCELHIQRINSIQLIIMLQNVLFDYIGSRILLICDIRFIHRSILFSFT